MSAGGNMAALSRLRTIDDLLAVEDDVALLQYRCPTTGLLVWPLIRLAFLREILGEGLYAGAQAAQAATSRKVMISAMARASWHDLSHPPEQADVLIMASGVGHQLRRGHSYNRLADPFVDAAPAHTLLVEDLFNWHWPAPRDLSRVAFHTPLQAAAAITGRLLAGRRHRELAGAVITLVASRARAWLDWSPSPERQQTLVEALARKIAALPFLQASYRMILDRVRPRLLLKEEACYGPSAMLMSVAREFGITTAEYQHGVVASGHDAYNFAPALRTSTAWRGVLPDWFLGYGQWWTTQFNAPVQTRVIGNPHRSLQLKAMTQMPAVSRAERLLLVLGDGIETEAYLDLARAIASAQPEATVVFRPHPLERHAVVTRFPTGIPLNDGRTIELDVQPDIYMSFRRASVVISEMSTGLFEAVGLVPSILLWDTPKSRFTFREHPFTSFSSVDDCLAILQRGEVRTLTPADESAIWAPDWEANYVAFLQDIAPAVGSTHPGAS